VKQRLNQGGLAWQRVLVWAVALVAVASGCSAGVKTGGFTGICAEELDRCEHACGDLKGSVRDCELSCEFDARICNRRNGDRAGFGEDVEHTPRIGELGPEEHMAADFREGKIVSDVAFVNKNGPIVAGEGAFKVSPGGAIRVTFPLKPGVRDAELSLMHATGGSGVGCFITVAVSDNPLISRYVPPRRSKEGLLHVEKWDVSPILTRAALGKDATEPVKVVVFIYNNQAAGSKSDYLLGRVELAYRAPLK